MFKGEQLEGLMLLQSTLQGDVCNTCPGKMGRIPDPLVK